MSVHEPTTVAVTDDTFPTEVLQADRPVLVDFWAGWCGPCKMVAPVLEEIAAAHAGTLTVAKIDIDANPKTPQAYSVASIPTLILFENGRETKRIVGARAKSALLRELADVL